jgi:hypothetical protein
MTRTTVTRRAALLALSAAIGLLLPVVEAGAQEQLPTSLKGRWLGMGQQAGKTPIDFAWSIEITKQNPDGTLEGTMTYGAPMCKAKDAPMTGRYDGEQLIVSAELQPKAQCGVQTFRLKKTGGKHLFEVRGRDRDGYLDPN